MTETSNESIRDGEADRRDAPAPLPGRRVAYARAVVAVLLVLHVVLVWAGRSPGVATGQDDVEYLTLAQSIRQGGYADLMRVDSPVHAQYPPGYPAVLAAWSAVIGDSFDGFLIVSLLCSVATLALLFHAIRQRFGDLAALAALTVLAVNPHWNAIAGAIRSEMPYTLLTIGALVLAAEERQTRNRRAATIALGIGAALTRSIGITLLVALAALWLWQRQWKVLTALVVASVLIVGPWMAWTAVAPEQRVGSSYVAEIRAIDEETPWTEPLPQRVLSHARWYVTIGLPHNMAILTIPGTPLDNAVAAAVVLATSIAGLALLLSRWRAAPLYVLAYAGLLVVWIWSTERFVVPLLPLLVPAILLGTWRLGVFAGRRAGLVGAGIVAGVLIVSGAVQSVAQAHDVSACRTEPGSPPGCLAPEQVRFFEALDWIERALPADAVILSAKNGAMYWYTGRKTISYAGSLAQDSASFVPWVRNQGAEYVLLSRLEVAEDRLARLIALNCRSLEVAARFSYDAIVFGLAPAERSDRGEACDAIDEYRRVSR